MRARSWSRPVGGRRPAGRPAGRLPRVAWALAALTALLVGAASLWVLTTDEEQPRAGAGSATTPGPTPASPATVTPTPAPTPTATPTARPEGVLPAVERLTADDRHALSVAASRATMASGRPAPVVYLVADDALDLGWAAVPAAAARGGGVLLTDAARLPEVVVTELERLAPVEIVLVGDRGSISDAVATAAGRLAPRVVRVDHSDPVAAAREITRAAFPSATEVFAASASRTSEVATASALAAGRGAPLLVTTGDAVAPEPEDAALLRGFGVAAVTRVSSQDPAAAHSDAWGGAAPAGAVVANPARPTDAFTGAVLAGGSGAPLLPTLPHCLPAASRAAVLRPTVSEVTVVGGERAVRSSVDRFERCLSTTEPDSAWVLVNKRSPLSPRRFDPPDLVVVPMDHAAGQRLRRDAAEALAAMADAAVDAGVGRIGIDTAYRSFETQEALYAKFLARRGREWTDRWYLRAGYSEHQTGLTVDLLPIGRPTCTINDCIDETPQGEWLARSSWRYGFILRYEKGETPVTGVGFEPWHFRYIGRSLARAYHDGGWRTYEEFLGRPAAPTY